MGLSCFLAGSIKQSLTEVFNFFFTTVKDLPCINGPGARFSKVPIINGSGKLCPSTFKIEVSIALHLT